jgi:hypothetical protein
MRAPRRTAPSRRIAFNRIASAALSNAESIVQRWLPGGAREGPEWVARNPTRSDGRRGSFKVNTRTGRWGDFATGEGGGDLISLAAYLFNLKQAEAACRVAEMVGVDAYE